MLPSKVLRVSTVSSFVDAHLSEQIRVMIKAGFSVSVATSNCSSCKPINGVTYFNIDIPREISLFKDILALIRLYRLFKVERFSVVHSTTPKAGLLCALAGFLAFVPIRIHTYTGQRWATLSGIKRKIVKFSDKIIGYCTTSCYADSQSQRLFLIAEKIIAPNKLTVLGEGSISGVDLARFNSVAFHASDRDKLKGELGIPNNAFVLLFVGRLSIDKGIVELIEAFNEASAALDKELFLILVGPHELSIDELGLFANSPSSSNIISIGYSSVPEKYMSISDILCIPSYREGFGTVVIEAAAMGLPAIGTNICGLSDAIVDGKTGLLVNKQSSFELKNAIIKLVDNKDFLEVLSLNAKKRVVDFYSSDFVNGLVVDEYMKLINDH